jgi:hypothetical protein
MDWSVNQNYVGSLLWLRIVMPVQNAVESAIVGIWNREDLPFCQGVRDADGENSFVFNGVVQKILHTIRKQRNWSHLYSNSSQGSEEFLSSS